MKLKARVRRLLTVLAASAVAFGAMPVAVAQASMQTLGDDNLWPTPGWYVAIVLDGKLAQGPEAFAAQLAAISEGLDNEVALPRDGRFGISVTLPSTTERDPSTGVYGRVIVPMTQITSDADIVAIQETLRTTTLPSAPAHGDFADGFYTAIYHGLPNDNRNAMRSVCQLGDGYPYSALRGEVRSGFNNPSLWRYDFVATGPKSLEYAADWEALAIGGTGLSQVSEYNSLAEAWVAACLTPVPRVRGIEVNQSVQNLDNDVVLIEDKATVVRVFAESVFPLSPLENADHPFTATLSAIPISPYVGEELGPLESEQDHVWLSTDFTRYRNGSDPLNSSLDFVLPDEWLTGNYSIRVNVEGGATCTWTDDYWWEPYCGEAVFFRPTDPMYINVYRVTTMAPGGTPKTTSPAQVTEQIRRITSAFPVAHVDFELRDMSVFELTDDGPSLSNKNGTIWSALKNKRLWECFWGCDEASYHLALIPTGSGGQSSVGSHVSVASVALAGGSGEGGARRNTAVHELGHANGLTHALATPVKTTYQVGWVTTQITGYCHAKVKWPNRYQQWTHSIAKPIGSSNPEGSGPVTEYAQIPVFSGIYDDWTNYYFSPREEYWGLDTRQLGNARLAFSDPRYTGELMSYVNIKDAGLPDVCILSYRTDTQSRWISPESYNGITSHRDFVAQRLEERSEYYEAEPSLEIQSNIAGTIDLDDGTVDFMPIVDAPDHGAEYGNTSGVILRILDATGNQLTVLSPTLFAVASDPVDGVDEHSQVSFEASFVAPEAAEIRLEFNGNLRGSISASANAPTVTLQYPNSGATLTGDTVDIEWIAGDADGDPLTYAVLYSADGVYWEALATDLTDTHMTIPRSQLTGSSAGTIRIAASDAFYTTYSVAEELTVAGSGPTLLIASPYDGATYWGQETVPFEVLAADNEDGGLDADLVTWTSDIDGSIVLSSSENVRASDLSEGVHVITATVTDSDGISTSASSTIEVFAEEPPDVVEWAVTFDSQGGSEVDEVVVTDGGGITPPADPTRPGYTFAGWFTAPSGGEVWDFTTATVAADMTLYAQWTVIEWTVAFDSQGGSGIEDLTINDGELVARPLDPTRVDYTFDGWFTAPTGGEEWDFGATTVNADVTLYAHWTFVPGLLSDLTSLLGDVLLVADAHFLSAVSDLAAASSDSLWLSEDVPADQSLVLTSLYDARSALTCTLPFATAETGESGLIARIDTVLADLDPLGTAAPDTTSCGCLNPFDTIRSIIAAYRSIIRGDSLKYLVEEARDVLAASGDPHFLAAADRLDSALDAVHWQNKNHLARNDTTVQQALTDVQSLLRCDVVGEPEEVTAREARYYVDMAVWVTFWRQHWR